MKLMKRILAASLALLLAVPVNPVLAMQRPFNGQSESGPVMEGEIATDSNAVQRPQDAGSANGDSLATGSNAGVKLKTAVDSPRDEVSFNTGNCKISVVSQEDMEHGFGDVVFEEDGSYIIQIPEENPFFPYEVQFTYGGKIMSEWFMNPDDSVTVGGHEFRVSAFFDGSVITQMQMEVSGCPVVVYPEAKTFMDGDGIMPASLLPLEERHLTVDLRKFTPVELTMVSLDSIFMGENALEETDKVLWERYEDSYTVLEPGDVFDLSGPLYSSPTRTIEMIVGENDQLEKENVRYYVMIESTESKNWLIPTVYKQDEEGNREEIAVLEDTRYSGMSSIRKRLQIHIPRVHRFNNSIFIGLKINPEIFPETQFKYLEIYKGEFDTAEEAISSKAEITSQIYDPDMGKIDGGYLGSWEDISIVVYDEAHNVTGFLPLFISVSGVSSTLGSATLYSGTGEKRINVEESYNEEDEWLEEDWDGIYKTTYVLKEGYKVDEEFYLVGYRVPGLEEVLNELPEVYEGLYESSEEAKKAGAKDISSVLFDQSPQGGYAARFDEYVYFTEFRRYDEMQEEYTQYAIKVVESQPELWLDFEDIKDKNGRTLASVSIDPSEDSYAEGNFLSRIVESGADCSDLSPIFRVPNGAVVHTRGSSIPEISGKSRHDFSNGPVQYTVTSKDGKTFKNYWLNIVQPVKGKGELYISSLSAEGADTRIEDGVIYSNREMFLDGRYDYIHDILFTNIGTEKIENLSAELVSDEVEMDSYWTFKGNNALEGIRDSDIASGKMANRAKIQLEPTYYTEDGSEIHGTLTIKSGDTILMVLNLTGIVGDPSIVTEEIPKAVKYVPYSAVIQNNNKYDWNHISYHLADGELPEGMILKENGELYGVPKEAGNFTFVVSMENSHEEFSSSEEIITLEVSENTDTNVDDATDPGYELTQRIPNISLSSTQDYTMVSEGAYEEFVDLYLDGTKLARNQDYTAESGSTRITIKNQTLKANNTPGTHTLGLEFREKDSEGEETIKRAAQNYQVAASDGEDDSGNGNGSENGNGSGNGSGSGSGSGSSSGGSSGSASRKRESVKPVITQDPKKGYMSETAGIITGTGSGYSHWEQDETGWKLIYADGTAASGHMTVREDKTETEQVLWEKVDGFWYAFGVNTYLKSGWVFDEAMRSWYFTKEENGMQSGWYADLQDGQIYYLEPGEGNMAAGWRKIEGKWYFFNNMIASPTWILDEKTGTWQYDAKNQGIPFGALYRSRRTPDGYETDENGVWIP